jgi:curved DNA-binding protein CbpA
MVSYYVILGISEKASQDEIKAAFKKKAVQFHPDKHAGDLLMEEKFKEVNRAYQVLSNPYEKARYDLQLKFGHRTTQETYYQPPPPPPRPKRKGRPEYAEPEIDWKENWIATGYAFLFTFVVAVIVMTGVGIKSYLDDLRLQEMLTQRREKYNEALAKHAAGNIEETLSILNTLGNFLEPEGDMADFKTELVDDLVDKSEYHFERSEYQEAIFYYELLENHTEVQALTLKENLAISYKEVNQPAKSVEVLTQLLIQGYRTLFTYVELAEIHRDQLEDYESSLKYYQKANEVAKDYYESIYGKAYAVIISGRNLSDVHYRLYTGLADMYLRMERPERAVSATRWNIRVWPQSSDNYLIAAKGYEQLEDVDRACEFYFKARQINPDIQTPTICL